MTAVIAARARPGEIEFAVVRGDALIDYAMWRPGRPDRFGDLVRGRVTARDRVTGGSFVSIGTTADAFLPDRESPARTNVGERIAVRVIRSAIGGKGLRVSAKLAPGETDALERRDYVPGPSPLEELRARHPTLPVATGEIGLAARLAALPFIGRVEQSAPLRGDILGQIEQLHRRRVALPGGATASIVPTPALVAIDVDLAGAGERRLGRQAAQYAANLALLPALTDQIRMRNLGGAILIDFGGLAAAKRNVLATPLAEALARDPLSPRLLGFTALGLAEIVRAPRRPPLHELRGGAYAALLDAAQALVADASAPGPGRPSLRLAPALHAALDDDPLLVAELATATGRRVRAVSDPMLAPGAWSIEFE